MIANLMFTPSTWYPTLAIPLHEVVSEKKNEGERTSEWMVMLPVEHSDIPLEYKFIIRDKATTQVGLLFILS